MGLAVKRTYFHVDVADQLPHFVFAVASADLFTHIIELSTHGQSRRERSNLFASELLLQPPVGIRWKVKALDRLSVAGQIAEGPVLHTFANLPLDKRLPLDARGLAFCHDVGDGCTFAVLIPRPPRISILTQPGNQTAYTVAAGRLYAPAVQTQDSDDVVPSPIVKPAKPGSATAKTRDATGSISAGAASAERTGRPVEELVSVARQTLQGAANPSRALDMANYMKGIAPYFGVASAERRALTKDLRAEAARYPEPDLLRFAVACFDEQERELHYVALDVLERREKTLGASSLSTLRQLVQTKSWWDTVDPLSGIIGAGVRRFPKWVREMEAWAVDPDMWIRRVAILHQLGCKTETDLDRLERIVLVNAGDREFFIRKAIGWALRDLAWHRPQTVAEFVEHHESVLSPLSVREATKNLKKLM